MKKEWLVKTLALGIIVLFIGVAIVPSINTIAYQSSNKNIVKVEFIGINHNKSYSSNMTLSEVIELKKILDAQGKTLSNEPLETMKYIFTKLETSGLMEKNDTEFLVDLYQKNLNFEKILKSNKLMKNSNDFSNIFCYLILHTYTGSSLWEIGLIAALGVFLFIFSNKFIYNNFILLAYLSLALAFLLMIPSMIYNKISPLKFWNLIESPSPNDFYSIGLKGIVNLFNKTIVIWGFRGIRILLPDINESYYIGHAMATNAFNGGEIE